MDYNYEDAIREDVLDYIKENYDEADLKDWNREDFAQELNDILFTEDSVTGNASGSYTCNTYRAKEMVTGDDNAEDYIRDLIFEFGIDPKTLAEHIFDWEYWDVSIRCYLLGQAIEAALDELEME